MKYDLWDMSFEGDYSPSSEINNLAAKVLQWYHPECILVRDFQYDGGIIQANIIPYPLNYGIIDMPYLTATQLTLVVSQLGYVLTACLCLDPSIEKLQIQDYATLLKNIPSGECLLTNQNWIFRKKISKDCVHSALLKSERIRIIRNGLILRCSLNVGDGSALGESNFFMPL